MLNVTLIPILKDNYCYLIQSQNATAIIDAGEAESVITHLEQHKIIPQIIFNTHHHWDHVNGNKKLKKKYNCIIMGPEDEKDKIPLIEKTLSHGNVIDFGDEQIEVMKTAGHTIGHICFYFKNSKILFSGDTLFSLGCGRLFEGTADDLFQSLEKIKQLPDDTLIYCGHEYTENNARFCLTIEPNNQKLIGRAKKIKELRQNNMPTIPTTLRQEKDTNCFLRCNNAIELKKLRELKDSF